MILGDLGAEIVKLEHPGGGDDTRQDKSNVIQCSGKLLILDCVNCPLCFWGLGRNIMQPSVHFLAQNYDFSITNSGEIKQCKNICHHSNTLQKLGPALSTALRHNEGPRERLLPVGEQEQEERLHQHEAEGGPGAHQVKL